MKCSLMSKAVQCFCCKEIASAESACEVSHLVNPSVKLKIGPNFEDGAYHLQQLYVKFGKEQHFLHEEDLN